jgi:hypothetical protein
MSAIQERNIKLKQRLSRPRWNKESKQISGNKRTTEATCQGKYLIKQRVPAI